MEFKTTYEDGYWYARAYEKNVMVKEFKAKNKEEANSLMVSFLFGGDFEIGAWGIGMLVGLVIFILCIVGAVLKISFELLKMIV
jgi:hypothetical protein